MNGFVTFLVVFRHSGNTSWLTVKLFLQTRESVSTHIQISPREADEQVHGTGKQGNQANQVASLGFSICFSSLLSIASCIWPGAAAEMMGDPCRGVWENAVLVFSWLLTQELPVTELRCWFKGYNLLRALVLQHGMPRTEPGASLEMLSQCLQSHQWSPTTSDVSHVLDLWRFFISLPILKEGGPVEPTSQPLLPFSFYSC